ncbi:MAG: MBL fold metallo-hydrolase [Oscillospiraceae bacterium]|nr:MBL fold metallo-hydrolase [Oscillospiraceae bacterium]
MKVKILGAAKTVTGSNILVEGAGKKFLLDCGMYQGKITEEQQNLDAFEFNINDIDFMLLTHAHIDHSGRIPKLYKEGYRKPIYTTKATYDLCTIMLPDSGHIQETEAKWKNKKHLREGQMPEPPMYTVEEAIQSLEIFKPIQYDEIIDIDENIKVRFNDAGHMLGSAILEIWVTENDKIQKLVFTGDLGSNNLPLLDAPTMIRDTDFLIMESTYGGRLHMDVSDRADKFLTIVTETIEKGGRVIIPSFAVGRTQEILYELYKIKERETTDAEFKRKYEILMKTLVYVDSPLAISATEIFKQNMNLFNDEIKEVLQKGDNPLEFPGLRLTKTSDESKLINEDTTPSIIISASGMCEVGRIKQHLKHNIWNSKNTVLFVGYQAPGTLGYSIVNGAKKVKIFGEEFVVAARVEYIEGYSGHADQEWLLNFVYSFDKRPKHIFLVHGEIDQQVILKDKIQETTQIPVTIPDLGDEFDLEETSTLVSKATTYDKHEYLKLEVLGRLETLKEELVDMNELIKQDLDNEDTKNEKLMELNAQIKDLEQQMVKILEV